ncbi:MAG TPA: CoA transferase [Dehalococcoidia bacterium]|nr:CoA transferase [Dehalococcoidia bacterium]
MTMPLEGTRVVELTEGIAGPYCGMELGDAGADVIKVEPLRGDTTRGWPPFIRDDSAVFLGLNRNKRSISLDWETPAGRDVLERLIQKADVFVEDLGAGAAESLGLGYESMPGRHQELICCSITGFGDNGPFAQRPGSELVAQAMSEMTASLGVIGEAPERLGTDAASTYTGYYSFIAILAALFERNRSGLGQRVSASLLGSALFMRGTLWTAHSDPDEWFGFHLDSYVKPPDHCYQSKDGPFTFAFMRGLRPEAWTSLLGELGLAQMEANPHWANQGREAMTNGRYGFIYRDVWNQRFAEFTVDQISEMFVRHGGDVWRLNNYETLFAHPQTEYVDMVATVDHPTAGTIEMTGIPWKLQETPGSIRTAPPLLGQHTVEVLRELGYSEADVKQLGADHVAICRQFEGE